MVEAESFWRLEYEDSEIHCLLLALLDCKGIQPYESKLVVSQENDKKLEMNENMEETDLSTNIQSKIRMSPIIFEHNGKICVIIYPMVLPFDTKNDLFFYFREKLQETLNETQNFLQSQLLEEEFRNFHFKEIKEWKFTSDQSDYIQSDQYYSGGAVRRIIGGLIFNNDPFEWQGIDLDLEAFKLIKPNRNDIYILARKADIELLLSCGKTQVQICGKNSKKHIQLLKVSVS